MYKQKLTNKKHKQKLFSSATCSGHVSNIANSNSFKEFSSSL